jgi:hypothetical protein
LAVVSADTSAGAAALAAMPDGVIPQLLPAIGVSATQVRAAVQEGYRRAG